MTIRDLEPDDDEEKREFTVRRNIETSGSTGYTPSAYGGGMINPGGSGYGVERLNEAYRNFVNTGVVTSDAVLGYERNLLPPQGISYDKLEAAGLSGVNEQELLKLATAGLSILGDDLARQVTFQQRDAPVRRSQIVNALPDRNLNYLAMDMFLNVNGAYRDIDEVFDDDGTVNMQQFNYALERTFQEAMRAGPSGFGNTTEFLDILTQNRDLDIDELQALFDEREEEIRREGAPTIVLFDPVGLAQVAKEGFVGTTGRRATKAEQKMFIRQVHKLQLSGQRSVDVGARIEKFAREAAPVEAAAMDEATAGSILMDVIRSPR